MKVKTVKIIMGIICGLILTAGVTEAFIPIFSNQPQGFSLPISPSSSTPALNLPASSQKTTLPVMHTDSQPLSLPAWDDESGWQRLEGIKGLVELLLTDENSWVGFNKREFVKWDNVKERVMPHFEQLLGKNLTVSERDLLERAWKDIISGRFTQPGYPYLSEVIDAPLNWEKKIGEIVASFPQETGWPKEINKVLEDFKPQVEELVGGKELNLNSENDRALIGLWALITAQRIDYFLKNTPWLKPGVDFSYQTEKETVSNFISLANQLKEGIAAYHKLDLNNITPDDMLKLVYWGHYWGESPWFMGSINNEVKIVNEVFKMFSGEESKWAQKEKELRQAFLPDFVAGKAITKLDLFRTEDIGKIFAFLNPIFRQAKTPEEEERLFDYLRQRMWLAVQMRAQAYEEQLSHKEGSFSNLLAIDTQEPTYKLDYWMFDKVAILEKTEENFQTSFVSGRLLALAEMALQKRGWREGNRLAKLAEWLNINKQVRDNPALKAAVTQELDGSKENPLYTFEKNSYLDFKKEVLRNSTVSQDELEKFLSELGGLVESAFPEIYKQGIESSLTDLAVNKAWTAEKLESIIRIKDGVARDEALSSILKGEINAAANTEFYKVEKEDYKDEKVKEFEEKGYILTEEDIKQLRTLFPQEADRLEKERKDVIDMIDSSFSSLFRKGKLMSLSEFADKKGWEKGKEVETLRQLLGYKNNIADILRKDGLLDIKEEDPLYRMALEEFLIQKALDQGIDLGTNEGKQALGALRKKYSLAYKDAYFDGVKFFWAETMFREVKARMEEKKETQPAAEGEVLKLLDTTFANYKALKDAGLTSKYPDFFKPQSAQSLYPLYQMSYEEFILDKKLDKGEEFVNKVKDVYDKYFVDFFADTNLLFWAGSLAKEGKKVSATGPRKQNLEDLEKFFSENPKVQNLVNKFPRELTLTEKGENGLLDKIMQEKVKEKGISQQDLPKYREIFQKYLKTINLNGVASYWTQYMVRKNYGLEGLKEIFIKRGKAIPLLQVHLGQKEKPEIDLSNSFISGLVTLVAENLEDKDFSITAVIDKEFVNAYLTDEREFINRLLKTTIPGLAELEDFLGKPVNIEENERHAGFVGYLTNFAWRLMKDKKMTEAQALDTVTKRLRGIKEFIVSSGLKPGTEEYANFIEDIIADPKKMGKWGYYADLNQPLNKETHDLEKSTYSNNFRLFFERYQNAKPLPKEHPLFAKPEMLTLQFGKKLNWKQDEWATFKALLERYLGRQLFTSKEPLLMQPEERAALESFLANYLNSSIKSAAGDSAFTASSSLDVLILHKWAVILDTFAEGKTIEEKWQDLLKKIVKIRGQIEPLMRDYFGEPNRYDQSNPEHTGVLAYFVEKVFNQMFLREKDAKEWETWKVGPHPKIDREKLGQEEINPYQEPGKFLNKAVEAVTADLNVATELKPYVEKARLVLLDVTDPRLAGILWFHVDTLKDPPGDWVQFGSKASLIDHLENEAKVMVTLARQGEYLDIFDSEAMGALSYDAQHNFGRPEVVYTEGHVKSANWGPTVPEKVVPILVAGVTPEMLNSNPNWEGWDWGAEFEEERIGKDGKTEKIKVKYGWNLAMVEQIKTELSIAAFLKETVAKSLGVEQLDLNNPAHFSALMERAHKAYLGAKGVLNQWVREGKVISLYEKRGWSQPGVAKEAMSEKYGIYNTGFLGDYTPLRFFILKAAAEEIIPGIKNEILVMSAIKPLVEHLEGKPEVLTDQKEIRIWQNTWKSYLGLAYSIGTEMVLDKYKADIKTLGEAFILNKHKELVEEKTKELGDPAKANKFILDLYADEIEIAGKEQVLKAHQQEVVDLGVNSLASRVEKIKPGAPKIEPPKIVPIGVTQPPAQPPTQPPTQPPPSAQAPTISQSPAITLVTPVGNGLSISWQKVSDSSGKEVRDYQWQVLDSQGRVVKERETNILSVYIDYREFTEGNYTFKVRGVIKEREQVMAEGPWTEQSFEVKKSAEPPVTAPTPPQPPAQPEPVAINQAPYLVPWDAGNGLSISWQKVKDSKGEEVEDYRWQILDAQGNVIKEGERTITSYWVNYNDFMGGKYIFRVQGIIRQDNKVITGPWSQYSFSVKKAEESQPASAPTPASASSAPQTPPSSPQVPQAQPQPQASQPTPAPQAPVYTPPTPRYDEPAPVPEEPTYSEPPRGRSAYTPRPPQPQRNSAPEHPSTSLGAGQGTSAPAYTPPGSDTSQPVRLTRTSSSSYGNTRRGAQRYANSRYAYQAQPTPSSPGYYGRPRAVYSPQARASTYASSRTDYATAESSESAYIKVKAANKESGYYTGVNRIKNYNIARDYGTPSGYYNSYQPLVYNSDFLNVKYTGSTIPSRISLTNSKRVALRLRKYIFSLDSSEEEGDGLETYSLDSYFIW